MYGDFTTENCLVCGEAKTKRGNVMCKMCGMLSYSKTKFKGFVFCCETCKVHFKGILSKSNETEQRELIKKEVVI